MSDKVITLLDRGDAELMRRKLDGWETKVPPNEVLRGIALDALDAALGRDPDVLIEQVARAIASQDRRNYTDGFERDFNLPDDYTDAEWEQELKARKEPARALARAAVSAITCLSATRKGEE